MRKQRSLRRTVTVILSVLEVLERGPCPRGSGAWWRGQTPGWRRRPPRRCPGAWRKPPSLLCRARRRYPWWACRTCRRPPVPVLDYHYRSKIYFLTSKGKITLIIINDLNLYLYFQTSKGKKVERNSMIVEWKRFGEDSSFLQSLYFSDPRHPP